MFTVEQQIWHYALSNPNKIAVKSGKDIVTYSQLVSRIIQAKLYFQSLSDFQKGKCIILAASKQIEFIYAYFGAHLAGLIVAPIDTETNPTRFSYIVDTIKPFCIIGFDKIETDIHKINLMQFKDLSNEADFSQICFPTEDQVADILFTTGTTGKPKGVPLTYKNEAAAARNINLYIQNKQEDIELLALPVSHSFGLGRLRCCLTNGQTIILIGSFVNTKKIFRIIEEDCVTGFTMVPSSWKFIQKVSGDKLAEYASQIKYIEMGSAFLSDKDKKHLAELFPTTRVVMHYGLTEASRSAFLDFHNDSEYLNSVGKASPFTEIKVFSEDGKILKSNQEGEICIKGEHVTKGYIGIDNENTFYGDYFRTGDLGKIDDKGYIYIKARIKEIINVGGKKVSPTEVEEQLLKIEGIEDCACIAIRDTDGVLGEVVKAFIVKSSKCNITFNDIRSYLVDNLENYKIPVEYEWIDKIPRTQNGKIQRNLLEKNNDKYYK